MMAAVGVTLASYAYGHWYLISIETREVKFQVTTDNVIGFDLNRTVITFGKVQQGGAASRNTNISSRVPAIAHIRIEPPALAEWLSTPQYIIPLEPDRPYQASFTLDIPENATPGNYTGSVTVVFTRKMLWD
jgi:hypothetical protein